MRDTYILPEEEAALRLAVTYVHLGRVECAKRILSRAFREEISSIILSIIVEELHRDEEEKRSRTGLGRIRKILKYCLYAGIVVGLGAGMFFTNNILYSFVLGVTHSDRFAFIACALYSAILLAEIFELGLHLYQFKKEINSSCTSITAFPLPHPLTNERDRKRLLKAVRRYVRNYIKRLRRCNFTCLNWSDLCRYCPELIANR